MTKEHQISYMSDMIIEDPSKSNILRNLSFLAFRK